MEKFYKKKCFQCKITVMQKLNKFKITINDKIKLNINFIYIARQYWEGMTIVIVIIFDDNAYTK